LRHGVEQATPSIVRDIRQRALLNGWLQLAAVNAPPTPADFHVERFQHKDDEVVFYAVVRQDDGSVRFRIDHDGNFLARAFGSSGRGQFVDDYIAPNLVPVLLPAYAECESRKLPVYMILKIKDEAGRAVSYQRLLLPFAEGGVVTRIMTSLKASSEDGSFELGNLLSGIYSTPETEIAALIPPECMKPNCIIHRTPCRNETELARRGRLLHAAAFSGAISRVAIRRQYYRRAPSLRRLHQAGSRGDRSAARR
jgi:hypothetical protein